MSEVDDKTHDLFATQHTDDADSVAYAKPPEKAPASKVKTEDKLAQLSRVASESKVLGICEGAAMFRRRLLDTGDNRPGCATSYTYEDLLADIGEVDEMLEAQYGEEYSRQIEARTK